MCTRFGGGNRAVRVCMYPHFPVYCPSNSAAFLYLCTVCTAVARSPCQRANPRSVMYDDFETLSVSLPTSCVLHVQINRPAKVNAMNAKFWTEFRECFQRIAEDTGVRAVVVSGIGEKGLLLGLDWLMATCRHWYETGERVGRKKLQKSNTHVGIRMFKPTNFPSRTAHV